MDGANSLAMNWLRDHNMGSAIISVRGLIWEKGWCGMVEWSGEFKSVFSSLHFCEVWSTFPWQRLLPERIPINRLWCIFSRIWFTSLSALSITLPLRSNHIGKRHLSCIVNTKIKTTTKSEQKSKTVPQKTLLHILFHIEQKTLEYCQVLLVSVWQISTWHNNFLSPYFSSCYFIVCHGNRKHLNKPTGNGNQIFTWEDVAWPFSGSLIILSEGFWIQGWQQGGECFLLRD